MMEHKMTVRFDGRRAAVHRLGANDFPDAYAGARRILGALGHAYCYGYIPRNKLDKTELFHLEGGSAKQGSVWFDLFIEISGSLIYDIGKIGFTLYAISAFEAWREGRIFQPPEYTRIEPTFGPVDLSNDPVIDSSAQKAKLWADLSHQFELGASEVTRSVGTRSDYAEFFMDGQPMGRFDYRHHQPLDEAIEAALVPIRARRSRLRYN